MIINHIHNYADSRCVKSLNHLLILFDSYFSVIGIGRIASLGNVVVFRIISPVELTVGICLVYGCIVVYGEQMHVGNSKLDKIIHTNRLAVLVDKTALGECKVLALVV